MARLGRGRPTRAIYIRGAVGDTRSLSLTLSAPTGTITGAKGAAGSVSGTLSAPSGTGSGSKAGSGSISASPGITITGSLVGFKSSGIGSIPRVRAKWKFVLGPASGGHERSLTDASDRRVTFRLMESHDVAFKMDGRHPTAEYIQEMATDVHVLWTDTGGTTQELTRLRLGASSDDVSEDAHDLSFGALDYRAILNRRELYSDAVLTYSAIDQAMIGWYLINYAQFKPGGNLGISPGIGQTTGVNRDVVYEAGDMVGARIQELSEMENGFDWEIRPDGSSGLTYDVWYPSRGTFKGVVLERGGLATRFRRDVDPSNYANAIRYTGGDVTPTPLTPVEIADPNIASLPEGRWDAAYGDTTILNQGMLNSIANNQLAWSEVVRPTYTITLRRGAWEGPDHIWLGDGVRVIPRSGRLRNVDTVLRVYELSVTIDSDGADQVEITVGGPKPDYRKRPKLVERRLSNLERR